MKPHPRMSTKMKKFLASLFCASLWAVAFAQSPQTPNSGNTPQANTRPAAVIPAATMPPERPAIITVHSYSEAGASEKPALASVAKTHSTKTKNKIKSKSKNKNKVKKRQHLTSRPLLSAGSLPAAI